MGTPSPKPLVLPLLVTNNLDVFGVPPKLKKPLNGQHDPQPNSFAHVARRSWIFFSSMLGSEIFSQQCLKVHPPRLYTSELRCPGRPRAAPGAHVNLHVWLPMALWTIDSFCFNYALSSNWLPRDKIDKIDNNIYCTSIYCTYTVHIEL